LNRTSGSKPVIFWWLREEKKKLSLLKTGVCRETPDYGKINLARRQPIWFNSGFAVSAATGD
jgi:hypothetical protein